MKKEKKATHTSTRDQLLNNLLRQFSLSRLLFHLSMSNCLTKENRRWSNAGRRGNLLFSLHARKEGERDRESEFCVYCR